MEPTAQGVLAKTPLAHLVVYCLERKLQGALVLRPEGNDDNSAADVITLVDGCPAKIRTAESIEHLGRVLVEIGAIDDAAYNESLMALGRGEGLVGQILLKNRKIDGATLEKGLRAQIVRKLGHLFSHAPGTRYAYYDGADFLSKYGGAELFPVDPRPAIVASVRSNPSMSHADATVDKMATTPLRIRSEMDLGKLDLTRAEKDVVALLKLSSQTPQQLIQAGVADARTTKLLVYALLLLKYVEAAPASPVAESQSPVAMPKPEHPALGRQPSPVARIALQRQASPANAPPIVEVGGGDGRDSAPISPRNAGDPQRRAEIVAKAKAVESENYFQILGLAPESTVDEAKTVYFQLAKRWHPDRLPAELGDLKDQVGKVFALMSEAYQVLTDQDRRLKYQQQVKEGGGTLEAQQEVVRAMDAANAFQKAEFFVNKGQLQDAEPHILKAYELEPKTIEHIVLWCWLQANKPERRESGRYDDLIVRLDAAVLDSPKSERAKFYRGMVLKAAGRMNDAIRDFREVAEANPRNVDAVREVRLYTMRSERDRKAKDEGSGSLLGRFIKRK